MYSTHSSFSVPTERRLNSTLFTGDNTEVNELSYNNDESSETEHQIILCIDVNKRKFGCSIFDFNNKTLRALMQDFTLVQSSFNSTNNMPSDQYPGDIQSNYLCELNMISESILLEYNPTLCILSSRVDGNSYNFIQQKCNNIKCKLELLSIERFKKSENIEKFEGLNISNLSLLQNIINNKNTTCDVTVSTICCIISYIYSQDNNNSFNNDIDNSSNIISGRDFSCTYFNINSFVYLNLNNRMFVDEDTLYSLNILPRVKISGKDNIIKDGRFSLYELLDKTSSQSAKQLLKSWLVCPLTKIHDIQKRHDMIDIFVSNSNSIIIENIAIHIKRCPDINGLFQKFKTNNVSLTNWCTLSHFLEHGIKLFDLFTMLKMDTSEKNIVVFIKENIDISILKSLHRLINSIIDIDISKENKELIIFDGIDERLDGTRKIYNQLEEILGEVANDVENSISEIFSERGINPDLSRSNLINAVYIPQLGYLITIDCSLETLITELENFNWEEVFRTPTNIYYKTEKTRHLDDEFGDIYGQISDMKIDILLKLQLEILKEVTILLKYNSILIEVDVLLSFSEVSKERNYIKPELSEDKCIINIEKGRHALYETLVDTYIPNDIYLDGGYFDMEDNSKMWHNEDEKRVAIITGANASGKSVFLTQTALIVYMAQIGSFVPAEYAKIGIVDKILSKIQIKETISNEHSSFELDAKQMAKCLSLTTERSLIIVDEFGKGTDIVDGPSLLGGILIHILNKKACPRLIGCTHFQEIFKDHIIPLNYKGIKHYTTEILLNKKILNNKYILNSSIDENQGITFLFNIKEGISRQSFGIFCASVCGIQNSILQRASLLNFLIENGHNIVDCCGKLTKEELKEFNVNQDIVKTFLSWDLDVETISSNEDLRDKLLVILEGKKLVNLLDE